MIHDFEIRLNQIRQQLDQCPKGTLTYKTIKGKRQPYLQWTEHGRTRSRYIKKDERDLVLFQIQEREELKKELGRLQAYADRIREILAVNPYLDSKRVALGDHSLFCSMNCSTTPFISSETNVGTDTLPHDIPPPISLPKSVNTNLPLSFLINPILSQIS